MLEIFGEKCTIHDSGRTSTDIEKGEHLSLWGQNSTMALWIDRYDVRTVLDTYDEFRKKPIPDIDVTDENDDLQFERFRDLLQAEEDKIFPLADNMIEASIALPEHTNDETFTVPAYVEFPLDLKFPSSLRQFEIIVHTAKSILENPQLEILLKLKERDSPWFEFLKYDSELHSLYQFIKSLPENKLWALILRRSVDSPPKTSDASRSVSEESAAIDMATTSSALALLSQYSDESESDDYERSREPLPQPAVQDNDDTAGAIESNDKEMPVTGKIHSLSSEGVSEQEGGGILSSVKALVQRATELFGGCAGVMLEKYGSCEDAPSFLKPGDTHYPLFKSVLTSTQGAENNISDQQEEDRQCRQNKDEHFLSDDDLEQDLDCDSQQPWCIAMYARKGEVETKRRKKLQQERLMRAKRLAGHFLVCADTDASSFSVASSYVSPGELAGAIGVVYGGSLKHSAQVELQERSRNRGTIAKRRERSRSRKGRDGRSRKREKPSRSRSRSGSPGERRECRDRRRSRDRSTSGDRQSRRNRGRNNKSDSGISTAPIIDSAKLKGKVTDMLKGMLNE